MDVNGLNMSFTHGGRKKNFEWKIVGDNIDIKNEDGREHTYSISETYKIIRWLKDNFGEYWFPLANNVKLMGSGKEKDGLGIAILNLSPDDITHAQGSSYLGVVLEEVDILEWNGATKGIKWRIVEMPKTANHLKQILNTKRVMNGSRRGRIIELLNNGCSDDEILHAIDGEFHPGKFSTSNKRALFGTKWDLGKTNKKIEKFIPEENSKSKSKISAEYDQFQLVEQLKQFNAEPVIDHYRKHDLLGKSPNSILFFSVDNTIYRAFRHENPSQRYKNWRWHKTPEKMITILNGLKDQEQYDDFAYEVGYSLVLDWGKTNDRGEPTRMKIGVAMKITNLVLKHLSFSSHSKNPALIDWLHVPWDSFTLKPLRKIWKLDPPIPASPTQGFVKSFRMYQKLHKLISEIADSAGIPRIYYEFFTWNLPHQNSG